jgi:integrase
VQLLVLTGARRSEIGELRWSEVNDYGISLRSTRTKAGVEHDIPLSSLARGIVNELPHIGSSDFVFTTAGKVPLQGWSLMKLRLDKLAQIPPWRIHDLRRTTATGLQRLGIPLEVTESVLGHVSGSRAGIVGIYQRHSYREEKAAALEAWGDHVKSIVDTKGGAK